MINRIIDILINYINNVFINIDSVINNFSNIHLILKSF